MATCLAFSGMFAGGKRRNTESAKAMRRLIRGVLYTIFGAILLIALATALIGREKLLEAALGPVDRTLIDFAQIQPSDRPNRYLVCPQNYCAIPPGRISPVFELSAEDLRNRWETMIGKQPRITALAASADRLQFSYVQRSAVFRFPDTITVRFIPLGASTSTLAVFSRSHYGRSDFGVNRERVGLWIDELSQPDP